MLNLLLHPPRAGLMAAATLAALLASPAAACPDWRLTGSSASLNAAGASAPQRFTVQAGGPHDLRACGLPGSGRAAAAPHLDLSVQNAGPGTSLSFSVEASCDTVLLVNDAGGQWHYNDDSSGLNPALTLTGAANGAYDVWVGTYGTNACQAVLTVQASGGGGVIEPALIAEIGNIYAVQNGPTRASTFSLDAPVLVTRLQTYHWNDARGRTPGTIALEGPSGQRLGPWQARGEPGQGGVPNAYWVVEPRVRLQPGIWRVIDSDPATWSQNSGSGGAGFFALYGVRDGGVTPPDPGPQPGAGCPDWRLQGQSVRIGRPGEAQVLTLRAGGPVDLGACPEPGVGRVSTAPQVDLSVQNLGGQTLELSVIAGCDTVLLVNDASGRWHFNDDTNGLNPALSFPNAPEGAWDIWVGTYGAQSCDATLTLRAAGSAAPPPACPDPARTGPIQSQSFESLRAALGLPLRAGGAARIGDCAGLPGTGYADAAPQLTLDLRDVPAGGTLAITATASCDTVLLVRDPAGRWNFNDDRDGLNPGLRLEPAMAGRYGIWLGTYSPTACDATLTLRTEGGPRPVDPVGKPGQPPSPPDPAALPDPGNLMGFRNRVGQTLTFAVTGAGGGSIWGDGIYTDDSSLARAAVHAGVLQVGQTGTVRVTILPGQASYAASSRNGVQTSAYGAWSGSYRIEGAAAVQPPEPGVRPDPGTLTGFRDQVGQTLSFSVTGAAGGSIWGDGIYTDDSSLARAAVHAGVLQVGQTGTVRVTILPGQASYPASSRNGVQSGSWGAWSGSYRIEGAPQGAAPSARLIGVRTRGDQDLAAPGETVAPSGRLDALFRIGLTAPGESVTGIEIANTSGVYSVWDTVPGNGYWALAAVVGGRLVSRPDGTVLIPLGQGETVIDLYTEAVADQVADGQTAYRITVTLQSGQRLLIEVPATR